MKTIQLTPEIEALVDLHVKSGRYGDDLAVIQEGLRLLSERERIYRGRFEELKKEVAIGVEDLKQGRKVDGREVIQRLKVKNIDLMRVKE
ncbi:MAG: type II toxin-antitoxin system ParD family antitoxin [Oscillatoria sp. SIO1A7]|nr:type II toxin-antitoxin system ParD family antitoxin [Oscillatoria sp. SIO1A7]